MNQSFQKFIVIALAVALLTACEPGEPETKGQTGVIVEKTAKSKMNTERAMMISLLSDGDGLFRQLWPHLKQAGKAIPSNVFQVLKESLLDSYTEAGLPRANSGSYCQ